MDSIDHNHLKSYTQVDRDLEDETFRIKTRKRVIIITISSIILVTIIVGALVGTLVPLRDSTTAASASASASKTDDFNSSAESIRAVCQVTLYPDSCSSSISSAAPDRNASSSSSNAAPQQIFVTSLKVALHELLNLSSSSYFNSSNATINEYPMVQTSSRNCRYLLLDAIDHVNISILSVTRKHKNYNAVMINDLRTWLSTAITDQDTCIEGMAECGANYPVEELRMAMQNSREYTSNSLAIISNLFTILRDFPTPLRHRKLLEIDDEKVVMNLKPNVTVAKDGTGDFTTINEALSAVPRSSTRKGRYLIYVKAGVYNENVIVGKDLLNLTMYGDGMNKTVVSGSLNWVDRTPTFTSGTFIAEGKGFIGIDMGFKNTAGPKKEQAVALRSSSDHSIFYRCSFDAYQDTLYAHSNRQFYRDCYITGTVDFIFGNAAVIFQNCSIQPRKPLPKQFNAITAQSKSDPNQNTGISIQRCRVFSSSNINNTTKTYLGRPWTDYSTTIFMESDIGGVVDPAGWTQWTPNVDPRSSIFYAEYQNTGMGSPVNQRVQWGGYRPTLTEEEAKKFSVESFLQGILPWLTEASVVFDAK